MLPNDASSPKMFGSQTLRTGQCNIESKRKYSLSFVLPHLGLLSSSFLLSYFASLFFFRKEVIQPHLPIRLPCYDFTPVICLTFGSSLLSWVTDFGCSKLPWCDGRCVQGPGTYSPQHADLRLLAIPASCSRVADYNPNWDYFFELCSTSPSRFSLS